MRVLLAGAVALLLLSASQAATEEAVSVSINLQTNDIDVASDGTSVQKVHAELHADNDAGAMRLNQVQLEFNSATQQLDILEAYTLKPDGTKIPIDMNAVFVRLPQDDSQNASITDRRVKVIIFPQLESGDVAVYTVVYKNTAEVFPGVYTFGIAFKPSAPLKEERDTIVAPKSLGLRTETHGVEFTSEDRGDKVVYRWHYAMPSPTAEKSVVISPMDELPRYFVSNVKDYAELGRAYGAKLASKLTVTPKVAALADKLTAGESDKREQIRKLYEWVDSNIRYIAIELGEGTLVPHDVDAILTYGYGDCKDHDLLLRALLKAKGIETQSVLLNGSNAYTLTQVPTLVQLDHVITYVPEMKLFLDSSALVAPFGVLPFAEYGKPAIFVSEQGASLGTMPVLASGTASESTTTTMQLSAAGVLTGKTTATATGSSQMLLRIVAHAMQAVSPDKIVSQLLEARSYRNATGTLKAASPLVRTATYSINGDFTIRGWSEWLTGTKVTYMPLGLRILGVAGDGPMGTIASLKSNAADPTPCFSVHQTEDFSLEIPAGTRFAMIPADTRVTTENIEFTAHWTTSGNTVSVHRDFRSTIDQPLCTGSLRAKTARAVFAIAASYLEPIRIVPDHPEGALVSQNEAQPLIAQDPFGRAAGTESKNAVALAQLGETDRAMRLINSATPTGAPEGSYSRHLAQGLSFLNASQLPQAVAELTEAIRINPEAGPEPYGARASAYSKMNKTRLALADLDTALKTSPGDTRLRQMHADLLVQERDYDGAAADYNAIVRAEPDDRAVVLRRADIRYHADKYEEAAADYRRALKLGAVEADVEPGLCRALARSEDEFAEAVGPCSKALAAEKEPSLLESRGVAYFRQGKFHEALGDFDAAWKASPDSARLLYERGIAQVKLGIAAGSKDIEEAARRQPNIAHRLPAGM